MTKLYIPVEVVESLFKDNKDLLNLYISKSKQTKESITSELKSANNHLNQMYRLKVKLYQ